MAQIRPSMFAAGFVERRDLEQYVWTRTTVQQLLRALEHFKDPCCLATPSLAHGMWQEGRTERLLDIDRRFEYLPGFKYWDLRAPEPVSACSGHSFQVVVFDPPFFYVPMHQLHAAVMQVCQGDASTKIMIGFLRREEPALLSVFSAFKLKRTAFVLEYATVKPNKWQNYALYSNVDLPGIKRLKAG